MTDEELQKLIKEVSNDIGSLSSSPPGKPLPENERRRKEILLIKKEILGKIKEARENNEKDKELHNTIFYGLLTSMGEKHPYLMGLVKSNLRWSGF